MKPKFKVNDGTHFFKILCFVLDIRSTDKDYKTHILYDKDWKRNWDLKKHHMKKN